MIRDPARAWVVLSTALFIMIYDGLESTWMRGFEFKWVAFLILAVDIGQYWKPPRPSGRSLKLILASWFAMATRSARRTTANGQVIEIG